MDVAIQRAGAVMTANVQGRIDGTTVGAFHREIEDFLEDSVHGLILDLTETTFVSSAGLRVVLIIARSLARTGGRIVLCGLSAQVREAFRISGFDKVIAIAEDREQAREML